MTARKFLTPILVALLVGACSESQTDIELIEQAKNHLDNGELRQASIQLKNALQQNSANAEARWLLGKVNLETGDDAAAEKEFRRAMEMGISDASVRPLLARALAAQGKHEEVLALTIDGLPPPAQAEVLASQASVLILQNKLDEAEAKVEQALARQADSKPAQLEQARLAVTRGELAAGKDMLHALLEHDNTYAPAWSLLGETERRDQQLEDAEAAFGKAIEYRVNNVTDLLKRALVRTELQKFDAAQADLDLVKRKLPNYFELHYAQGLLHFHQQQYPQALAAFELALKANEQFQPALFYLGATHFRLDQRVQAENAISRFVAASPGFIPGRKLLAQIRLQEGDFDAVERLLRPVLNADGEDVDALNLLAMALMQRGKTDEGVALLEKIVALQPQSAEAHLRLGSGLLAQGKEEKGMQMVAAATKLDPQAQDAGDKLIIQHYLKQQATDKALAKAQSYLQRNPDQADGHNLVGLVRLARNELEAAAAAFEQALQLAPGDVMANHNLAVLAIGNEDFQTARRHYEAILAKQPEHLDTLMKLARLDDLQQREADMVKHLEQAIAAHPTAVQPRTSLARHHLAKGEPEKVTVALGNLQQTHFDNPDVLEVLGRAQLARRAAEAQGTLARLVKLRPDAAEAHYLLGMAHSQRNDVKAVKAELQKSLELDQDHLAARLALTRLLLVQRDTPAARRQLETLKAKAPDNADVKLLEGRLAQASGHADKALDIYTELFESTSSTASMVALAQQRWETGDRNGAVTLLEQWLAQHPEDVNARMRLASAYAGTEQPDAAMEQYRKVLKQTPDNLVALNNLAWHLQDSAPAEALKYAEKANSLAPAAAGISDTLAVVLMKNGQRERALRMSQELTEKHPDNPSFAYHKAMILAEIGRVEEAATVLTDLLDAPRAFPERGAAKQMLTQLEAR